MTKKPRDSSCSNGWCKNHLLQLNPLSAALFHRKKFRIRLCPRHNKQSNSFEVIIPLFNKDKKYYTPSFYLEEEIKYYQQNDQRVLRSHNLKVIQDAKSQQTIFIPRHARKRNYCFVCKLDYKDYLEHLSDANHKKVLRNNVFNGFILEIQAKFTKQCKKMPQQKKQQDLKRQAPTQESSSTGQQISRSFQFIRKLVKQNQQLPLFVQNQEIRQNK